MPKPPARPRTLANEAAEKRYRQKWKAILVRFTPAEMKVLESALEDDQTAAAFLKEHGLIAARGKGKRP